MSILLKILGGGLLIVGGFLALKMLFGILLGLLSVAVVVALIWGGWKLLSN